MSNFVKNLEERWNQIASQLESWTLPGEELALGLEAEDSSFYRFNKSRVRQNTDVEQAVLEVTLHKEGRTAKRSINWSGDLTLDSQRLETALKMLRSEVQELPKDPHQVSFKNTGVSRQVFEGRHPAPAQLAEAIARTPQRAELVGFYSGGPRITAAANSAGTNHWFCSDSFFFDYSLYEGTSSYSSNISGLLWDQSALEQDLEKSLQFLDLMQKPRIELKPGSYRTYLAPAAMGEITSLLNWGGFSVNALKKGGSCLRRLAQNEVRLSPLLHLKENFRMGLAPAFNSLGELSDHEIPLVREGQMVQMLCSSRSSQEHGLPSNGAGPDESWRSLEMSSGTLPENNIFAAVDEGLYLSHLHYLNHSDRNSARITGMTRFAALWIKGGKVQGPIQDLRFDDSIYDIWGHQLEALANTQRTLPALLTYERRQLGGQKLPGALIKAMHFTL